MTAPFTANAYPNVVPDAFCKEIIRKLDHASELEIPKKTNDWKPIELLLYRTLLTHLLLYKTSVFDLNNTHHELNANLTKPLRLDSFRVQKYASSPIRDFNRKLNYRNVVGFVLFLNSNAEFFVRQHDGVETTYHAKSGTLVLFSEDYRNEYATSFKEDLYVVTGEFFYSDAV
jgi:hypothetical protein